MFSINTIRTLIFVFICILSLAIAGCGNSEKMHESWSVPPKDVVLDDNVISSNILSRFSSIPELESLGLNVRVENGEVFLSGSANTQAQIDQAVMQAWLVDGVQKLNNQVVLRGAQ